MSLTNLLIVEHIYSQWRSLTQMTGGSKTYIPKDFYRTWGLKTYIPKNFYTKTTYITLLSEKFGGSGAPPRPIYPSPTSIPILIVLCLGPRNFHILFERKM
ncbi:hypothetical protein Hanom_Chr14g01317321 [Helianthus anomalus]